MSEEMTISKARELVRQYAIAKKNDYATVFDSFEYGVAKGFIQAWEQQEERITELERQKDEAIKTSKENYRQLMLWYERALKKDITIKRLVEALEKIAQIHGEGGNCGDPKCNCGLPDWDIAKEALSQAGEEK